MSVRLDATTDQLTRANPPSVSAGITMVARVYNEVDQNDFATIGRIHASGSTIVTWSSSGDGTGGPNYFTGGGSITNSEGLPVGEWRDVAVTCTGTSAESYVRNPGSTTEKDAGTVSSSGTPTQLAIGGRGGGDTGEWWNGRVACFRVWTAVLSQAEIEAEWDSPSAVRTSNLWADWRLEDASDLADHSGNGRDLTAGSTSVTTAGDPPFATGGTTGEIALSVPLQTLSMAADVTVGGAMTLTVPLQTLSMAADVVVGGAMALAVPLQTLSLAGDVTVGGAMALVVPLQLLHLTTDHESVVDGPVGFGTPILVGGLAVDTGAVLDGGLASGTATAVGGAHAGVPVLT